MPSHTIQKTDAIDAMNTRITRNYIYLFTNCQVRRSVKLLLLPSPGNSGPEYASIKFTFGPRGCGGCSSWSSRPVWICAITLVLQQKPNCRVKRLACVPGRILAPRLEPFSCVYVAWRDVQHALARTEGNNLCVFFEICANLLIWVSVVKSPKYGEDAPGRGGAEQMSLSCCVCWLLEAAQSLDGRFDGHVPSKCARGKDAGRSKIETPTFGEQTGTQRRPHT